MDEWLGHGPISVEFSQGPPAGIVGSQGVELGGDRVESQADPVDQHAGPLVIGEQGRPGIVLPGRLHRDDPGE